MTPSEELFSEIKRAGYPAIEKLIRKKTPESTWLDYKLTLNKKTGKQDWDRTRAHFSKAVSGFGNSDGGLLIWGVDCPQEVPLGVIEIPDAPKLAGKLNEELSRTTRPSHPSVENLAIPKSSGDSAGVVVSYIPVASVRPLQAEQSSRKDFFIRAGESFGRAPYNLLAGMFGKPPHPEIKAVFVLTLAYSKSGFGLMKVAREDAKWLDLCCHLIYENIGSVVAREGFMIAKAFGPDMLNFSPSGGEGVWTHRQGSARQGEIHCGFVANDSFLFAPWESHHVGKISLRFPLSEGGRFETSDVRFDIIAGAKGSVPHQLGFELTAEQLNELDRSMTESGHSPVEFSAEAQVIGPVNIGIGRLR